MTGRLECRPMRVKSEIWVKAYLRRVNSEGAFAVVVRRGNGEAGAIYIKLLCDGGRVQLFVPAPAGFDEVSAERRWISHFGDTPGMEKDADDYLAQQADFDPDIWVIEVEDRAGRHFMDGWLMSS